MVASEGDTTPGGTASSPSRLAALASGSGASGGAPEVHEIAEVAVNVPLDRLFHYRIPEALRGELRLGHRVLVPFGSRRVAGVCVGFPPASEVARLKPIQAVLHPECRFDAHLLELTRWIASYYRAGWGEVLEAALPPAIRGASKEREQVVVEARLARAELESRAQELRRKAPAQSRLLAFLRDHPGPHLRPDLLRAAGAGAAALKRALQSGWIEERGVAWRPEPYARGVFAETGREPELNEDQLRALREIQEAVVAGGFQTFLLHGITGSGKTEVYLHALRQVIARGARGLVLLPEISLTPQAVARFRRGLPEVTVAVVHSMLGAAERAAAWRDIQAGRAHLVIGARSAVFSPISGLGLIIVDEEHEPSYKQESSPRYHARDVAIVRARLLGIPVVLGSATPSLESYHNARSGKSRLLELPRRATRHDLPVTSVITLEPDFYRADGSGLVSPQLDYHIRRTLRAREQALIYLNRRGFATYLHCVRCGFVLKCLHCDVTLTFHRRESAARCHYCGGSCLVPPACPDCAFPGPRKSGAGTEKVVLELGRRYPEARIGRLDRDAVSTHRALLETLSRFARGEYDLLVGTQMAAKGHDFPRVSLVGILLADTGLHFPDFRAAERTFQLITQVSGRAGRGNRPGTVVVQTFFPEHYAIRHAVAGDYPGFYRTEAESRRPLGYPPFGRLARVQVMSPSRENMEATAGRLAEGLRELSRAPLKVLGPAPSPLSRLQGRFRSQILLKSPDARGLNDLLVRAAGLLKASRNADVAVDVDPQSML